MKARVKLDKKALRAFFIDHGEKVAYGLVACCALVLIYLALSEKGYDKKPSDLTASIENAEKTMSKTAPEPPPECVPPDLQVGRGEIRSAAYAWSVPLLTRPVITKKLREMPHLCAVENLHGVAGVGAFSIAQGALAPVAPLVAPRTGRHTTVPVHVDSGVRGERFIVLTGSVPVEKQRDLYNQCFQTAQSANVRSDVPDYVGFFCPRAELSGDALPDKPQWSPMTLLTEAKMLAQVRGKWAGSSGEVAEGRYVDKAFCFPLPPRKDRVWGSEAVCEPEIPLLSREKPTLNVPVPDPTTPDDDFGGHGNRQVAPARVALRDQAATVALFRYFDFDVKPGHKYAYRVFLVLKNPNKGLTANELANPDDAQHLFVGDDGSTPPHFQISREYNDAWAATREAVAVPEEVQVLAVKVQPQRDEPTADIRTVTWLEEQGELAPMVQSDLHRGRLLDFPNCSYRPDMGQPKARGQHSSHVPGTPVSYLSGQILVDMVPAGGRRRDGSRRDPRAGQEWQIGRARRGGRRGALCADAAVARHRHMGPGPVPPPMGGGHGGIFDGPAFNEDTHHRGH